MKGDRRQTRQAKKTILVYTEGVHDAAFVSHIHSLYGRKRMNTFFKVRAGQGGSPLALVERLVKLIQHYNYDQAHISFDTDVGDEQVSSAVELIESAIKRGHPIKTTVKIPICIEALLITILEPKTKFSGLSTEDIKKLFHQKYIPENQRGDFRAYAKLFPESTLEEARRRIPELDLLIRQFDG